MKKKIIRILVCILLIIASSISATAFNGKKVILSTQNNTTFQSVDHTLITSRDIFLNQVIEVDMAGTIHWLYNISLFQPHDAERLENGNTLIANSLSSTVIEIDNNGTIVREIIGLDFPMDVERLDNGNTLITSGWGNYVIEVNTAGTIVWSKSGLLYPADAERLENGNTLIAEHDGDRVIEVDAGGTIVWEIDWLDGPVDVERLENGNTLITELEMSRVIEINTVGTILWEITLSYPWDAERLENGNTLIVEMVNNRVIEVDNSGIVWEVAIDEPADAERIPNLPPSAPNIDGPHEGNPEVSYTYNFTATDPDYDDIEEYVVKWGDGNEQTIKGPFASGEVVSASHTWAKKGTYTITAKAIDVDDLVGPEATFEVTMPRVKTIYGFTLLQWILQKYQNMFPLIRYLIEL
jgi:hypothetical protein